MSRIKHCFPSRFKKGVLLQFDYSQLEVVCLAYLSQDRMLMTDLKNGVDMHCMSTEFLTGTPYGHVLAKYKAGDPEITERRKFAKRCGFLVQYGGGAGALHNNTGLPRSQCVMFIDNYYRRYEEVKIWQDAVRRAVENAAQPNGETTGGHAVLASELGSVTGRLYSFKQQLAPEFMRNKGFALTFSPTQMKNYPVQGLATGDIVPMMVGKLNRWLKKHHPEVLLVNTIHDSVILDVPPEVVLSNLVRYVKSLLETAPAMMKEVFNVEFNMELRVDVEAGPTWGELKPYEIT